MLHGAAQHRVRGALILEFSIIPEVPACGSRLHVSNGGDEIEFVCYQAASHVSHHVSIYYYQGIQVRVTWPEPTKERDA